MSLMIIIIFSVFSYIDKILKEMSAQGNTIVQKIQIDGNSFDNDNFPTSIPISYGLYIKWENSIYALLMILLDS